MAPDVAKKAPKLCKKYTYTEHSKYSQWEKERRARFNDRLEELSRMMPGYSKENPWKKIEIIEQAINNITKRKVEASKSQEDAISGLAREVHQLKSIILQFTNIKNVNADVFKLTSTEIGRTLDSLAEQEKENLPPEPPDPEAEESLAFVAKIARSNDHDYIRTTEETPSLEVDGEVVVETAVADQEEQEEMIIKAAPPQPLIVDLVAEFDPQPLPSYITFEPTAAVASSLPEAPQLLNLQDIIWPRGMAAVPNVRTVFVNKGSRASLLPSEPITGVHKLPIPRLKPPKRRPRPKKLRRGTSKTKVKPTEKDETIENVAVNLPLTEGGQETSTKEINESLEALEAVEEALPLDKDDILQNNEEMEILEETIKEQGERETREKSEKDAKKKEGKRGSILDKDGEKVVVHKKKVDQGKKKSKSSYSIAALCQISVNIGDRPEMANSPGVLSLNSVGTMSPSHTPAPTPTPDPSKTFGMETCEIVIGREENVLEELRTIRPEDVTFETPGPSGETTMKKTVSPSQNFLTNFPAVSKSDQDDTISVSTKTIQRDIYEALKDLDKDLNLEPESLPEPVERDDTKPEEPKKIQEPIKETVKAVVTTVSTVTVSRYLTSCTTTTEAPPSTTSSALSVYDFSASKPDTPPIPLQKARKQEIRKEEGRVMPAYKSPEKKTYTEMQSKPKKSPVDGGKGKEVVGVAGQNQQYQGMEYQQVQGKQYHQPSATYQSRHQMYMGSHYPTYQGMGPLQQQHPYHHSPHHPYPSDEMKSGSHHSRYSCASHSYLPAPNYHHYPSAPKHYQGQPGWGQQHYPKSRDRGQTHMEMDTAGHSTPAQASGTTFTVNQLVNSGQRKSSGTKRSSTAGKGGSVAKTGRGEVAKEKEKEDCRKRSGATRRNKSGGRSTSYSAESLMLPSSSGLVVTADTKEDQAKVKVGPSPSKKESKMETMSGSRAQTTNTWANTDHFGGLQLSSLSPSPASLFPQDLSSLDFPMPMFGPGEGKDYTLPPSSQTQKTPGKQQAACQRAGTTSVVDWSLNTNILEGGWPLPTITPPGDPMADPMASYNFMSPVPHSHPGFYSCSAPQSGVRQGQGQSYSAHSAANIPVSGYSSSTMVMAKSGTSQPFPPSQVDSLIFSVHSNSPSCRHRRAPWSTSTSPQSFPRLTFQQLDTQPQTVR